MAIAKANCVCKTCGDTFEARAEKYNRREADAWENWAVTHIDECPECRRKRLEEARREETQTADREAAKSGWPDLKGSEKQISWAVTIRRNKLKEVSEVVLPEYMGLFDECAMALVNEQTSAAWWIENRDVNFKRMLHKMMVERLKGAEEHEE